MVDRYPPIEPYATEMLAVDGGQGLYWETSGNPDGTPAPYLHDGPGAGSSPGSRRSFDPGACRIVHFDQRGCGHSRLLASDLTATGDLAENTTAHLVAASPGSAESMLARWGGEEFVVLLPGHDISAAGAVLEALQPVTPAGQSSSAAIARWDCIEEASALVRRADTALYAAKAQGRVQCCAGRP